MQYSRLGISAIQLYCIDFCKILEKKKFESCLLFMINVCYQSLWLFWFLFPFFHVKLHCVTEPRQRKRQKERWTSTPMLLCTSGRWCHHKERHGESCLEKKEKRKDSRNSESRILRIEEAAYRRFFLLLGEKHRLVETSFREYESCHLLVPFIHQASEL